MTTKTFIEVQAHIPISSWPIFPAGHASGRSTLWRLTGTP